MTFTYDYQTSDETYVEETDECFSDCDSFEYEISYKKMCDAIDDLLAKAHFNDDVSKAHEVLDDLDLYDEIGEKWYDALKNYFEDEAFEDFYERRR